MEAGAKTCTTFFLFSGTFSDVRLTEGADCPQDSSSIQTSFHLAEADLDSSLVCLPHLELCV